MSPNRKKPIKKLSVNESPHIIPSESDNMKTSFFSLKLDSNSIKLSNFYEYNIDTRSIKKVSMFEDQLPNDK